MLVEGTRPKRGHRGKLLLTHLAQGAKLRMRPLLPRGGWRGLHEVLHLLHLLHLHLFLLHLHLHQVLLVLLLLLLVLLVLQLLHHECG